MGFFVTPSKCQHAPRVVVDFSFARTGDSPLPIHNRSRQWSTFKSDVGTRATGMWPCHCVIFMVSDQFRGEMSSEFAFAAMVTGGTKGSEIQKCTDIAVSNRLLDSMGTGKLSASVRGLEVGCSCTARAHVGANVFMSKI